MTTVARINRPPPPRIVFGFDAGTACTRFDTAIGSSPFLVHSSLPTMLLPSRDQTTRNERTTGVAGLERQISPWLAKKAPSSEAGHGLATRYP